MPIGTESATGLRSLKKRANRLSLQRAALELVAERGLAAVTIDEIAAVANMSPRSFFNYFTSKEESLFAFDPEEAAALHKRLETLLPDESPFVALSTVIGEIMARTDADPRDLELRNAVVEREPTLLEDLMAVNMQFEEGFVEAVRRRLGASDTSDGYPEVLVASCLAAARTALRVWCKEDHRATLHNIYELHVAHLERGLQRH